MFDYTLTGAERTGNCGWHEWQVRRSDGRELWIKNYRRRQLKREGRLIDSTTPSAAGPAK